MLSKQLLDTFAKEVFTPLKQGECVSCMFAAGGGKRTLFKYFLKEQTRIRTIFDTKHTKTLFVYIDPDEISNVTSGAYVQLLLDALISEARGHKIEFTIDISTNNSLFQIKQILEKLCLAGWYTVFILNDFEFTRSLPVNIYLNLESIMAIDKSKISYLFLSTINLFDESMLKGLHNLKHALSRNVCYFPLLNEDEVKLFINRLSETTVTKLSPSVKSELYALCGGHPQLLKYAFNNLCEQGSEFLTDSKKATAYLTNHFQLNIVCADIWNYLSEKEKEQIISIVSTGEPQQSSKESFDYLTHLGLIKSNLDKKYLVFGTLFEQFIKNKLPKHKLRFDNSTKKLYFGGKCCEDKFTHQEFKLLTYFINHENELVSRDQVAEAIWGKLYLEKYSDWSIDKTISILRKKLDALGFPSEYLTTLKKRGFSYSIPA